MKYILPQYCLSPFSLGDLPRKQKISALLFNNYKKIRFNPWTDFRWAVVSAENFMIEICVNHKVAGVNQWIRLGPEAKFAENGLSPVCPNFWNFDEIPDARARLSRVYLPSSQHHIKVYRCVCHPNSARTHILLCVCGEKTFASRDIWLRRFWPTGILHEIFNVSLRHCHR